MELGTKLKNARENVDIPQKEAADKVGVSRQTLSNWENGKTYPDIVSLIRMSDLYRVSMDALLRDDGKKLSDYVAHIDRAIEAIKNKTKLYKLVEISAYLVLTAVYVLMFWLSADEKRSEIYITMHTFLIPCVTVILSLLIGMDEAWGEKRWFLILFFGAAFGTAEIFTVNFDLLYYMGESPITIIMSFLKPSVYSNGAFLSFVGLGIGALARKFRAKPGEEK